jgi:redox-sensing transcriptional repressor
MRYRKIPDESVRRLPMYLRGLLHLTEQGVQNVSSQKLADVVGVNPPQIRKDLSYFGDFGVPGVGYNPKKLLKHIRSILKLNGLQKTALVGFGNLGSALLKYPGFEAYGLYISDIFDSDKKKIGKTVKNVKVQDISKLSSLKKKQVPLAILAVPATSAQATADKLVKAGVNGILNFAPFHLNVPKKVKVVSIDIAMDLAILPYYLPNSS